MSATITSSETGTVATTYTWRGTANASPTDYRVDGVLLGTNVVRDPETTALTSWAYPGSPSAAIVGGRLRVTPSGTSTSYAYPLPSLDTAGPNPGRFATSPGQRVTVRVEITNPNNSATIWANVAVAYYEDRGNQAGAQSAATPRQAILPGATATFELSTVTPPDATFPISGLLPIAYVYGTAAGGIAPASSLWESTHWQVEIGPTAPQPPAFGSPAPLRYFTGATPNTTVTANLTTMPYLVVGYESTREPNNVYHSILGGGTDVTLRPAELRSGTLRMLYLTEAAAKTAETMLSKAQLFYFDDPEVPSATMYWAISGRVVRTLDPDTLLRWIIAADYQEVQP